MGDLLRICNVKVYSEHQIIDNGFIQVEAGKIAAVGSMSELADTGSMICLDYAGQDYSCIPGMIDVHIHGVAGADVMDGTADCLRSMAQALPQEGTTSYLATTITQDRAIMEQALTNISEHIEEINTFGYAELLGIHLEGPFISPIRAGAQPLQAIIDPDVTLFHEWQQRAGGLIRLVTIAPERMGGLDFVRTLQKEDVIVSIGHSDASYEEVVEGIKAGISHVTHLFNGMRGLHQRDPGVVGAALMHKELMAELIVDGIHIHPQLIRLIYERKGRERLILITDSMRAKGLENGIYDLGGQEVMVNEGRATLADGRLAGSILKMKDAIQNMMRYAHCSLEDIIYMTSINPAKELSLYHRKGSINKGKDADLVILDSDHEVVLTLCRGHIAYQRS